MKFKTEPAQNRADVAIVGANQAKAQALSYMEPSVRSRAENPNDKGQRLKKT
jgi:hypothetical protein